MNETQVSQLPVYAGNDLGVVWRSSCYGIPPVGPHGVQRGAAPLCYGHGRRAGSCRPWHPGYAAQ